MIMSSFSLSRDQANASEDGGGGDGDGGDGGDGETGTEGGANPTQDRSPVTSF